MTSHYRPPFATKPRFLNRFTRSVFSARTSCTSSKASLPLTRRGRRLDRLGDRCYGPLGNLPKRLPLKGRF